MSKENQNKPMSIVQFCSNSFDLSNSCSNRWKSYKAFINDNVNLLVNICIPNLQTISVAICKEYADIYDTNKIPSGVLKHTDEILNFLKIMCINVVNKSINVDYIHEIFKKYEELIEDIKKHKIIDISNLIPFEYNFDAVWKP
jgi:hypothetical protein